MSHLRRYIDRQDAIGKTIPSPCVVRYDDDSVDYFYPAGKYIIEEENYILVSDGNGGLEAVSNMPK